MLKQSKINCLKKQVQNVCTYCTVSAATLYYERESCPTGAESVMVGNKGDWGSQRQNLWALHPAPEAGSYATQARVEGPFLNCLV